MGIFKKTRLFTIAILIAFSSVATILAQPNSAYAKTCDYDFYSANEVLYYDPCTVICAPGSSTTGGALVGNDNLEKILRYYVSKGLTLVQAAGIAGNYQQESSFNPAIIQGGKIAPATYTPVNGIGFGIAQWTFTGRQQPLVALAASTGRPIIDLSLQLDYSWKELSENPGFRLNELKAATTPQDAAYIFHKYYEVSADSEATIKQKRGVPALEIYETFKTVIPDGATTEKTANMSCTGNGTPSAYTSDKFVIYNQYDPQWKDLAYGTGGTIGAVGCGPSAMAMIITALSTTPVTPKETAAYGAANDTVYYLSSGENGGSKWNIQTVIGQKWGLKSNRLANPTVASINESLRAGALIITSGTGAAPYTSAGHYIVIRGVTAEGKWKIADSNGAAGIANSEKDWDPEFILSNSATDKTTGEKSNIWAVTK